MEVCTCVKRGDGQGGKASRSQTRALKAALNLWLHENIKGLWWAAGGIGSVLSKLLWRTEDAEYHQEECKLETPSTVRIA